MSIPLFGFTDTTTDILATVSVDNTTNNVTHGWGNSVASQFGTYTANGPIAVIPPPYVNTEYKQVSLSSTHGLYIVSGLSCFAVFATDVNVCASHGTCVNTNICVCRSGYGGADCSVPLCFGVVGSYPFVCSGHGICMIPYLFSFF